MKTIGLLIEETFYSFANLLVAGAEQGLRGSGARLVCIVGGALKDPRRWTSRQNILYDQVTGTVFDGLLVSASLGHFVETEEFRQFCHRWPTVPVVTISMAVPGVPSVDCDVEPGYCQTIRHLLKDHQLRRLAYLGGPGGQQESVLRRALFDREIREAGAVCRPGWVREGDFGPSSGKAAAKSLFETQADPRGKLPFDGLVCANDAMAAGAIEVLVSLGVRIPEDLAVTGFDGTPEWDLAGIPITTACQQPEVQAALAAQALLKTLETGTPPPNTRIPSRFQARRTCGCRFDGRDLTPAVAREAASHWGLVQSLRELSETLQAESALSELLPSLAGCLAQLGLKSFRLLLVDPCHPEGIPRLHLEGREGTPAWTSVPGAAQDLWDAVSALAGAGGPGTVTVVEALHSQDRPLGFLVLGCTVEQSRVSNPLRAHVSEALQSVLLLDELRRTERELIQAEKLRALGSLVAGLAHEMNTPLGVAVTSMSLIEDAMKQLSLTPPVETGLQALEVGLRSLDRMKTLVETFKQVSADHRSEERRVFSPQECLDLAVASCRLALGADSPVDFRVAGPGNLRMDSYRWALVLVFTNLLMNSLHHGFAPGQPGKVVLGFESCGDHVHFWVVDDGAGIPAEVQARMFEPFYTTKRAQGAAGLGLHIVHNQVSGLLGGTVRCSSQPGRGTRFDLDLPFTAPDREVP